MWRNLFRKIVDFFKSHWPFRHGSAVAEQPSSGPFEDYLAEKINRQTARKVVRVFNKLQLPLPSEEEFLKGTEGALMFVNRYGVVLRIEKTKPEFTDNIVRLDHNPLVLRPIASIRALDAIVEICPGSHSDNREKDSAKIKELLAKGGVDFWDDGAHNIGRLPFTTPQFPEGIPIVIDRLAVSKAVDRLPPAKVLLKLLDLQQDPQEALYGKLTAAFKKAWRTGAGASSIRAFWDKCEESVKKGDLIAGWNEKRRDTYKISDARKEARHYELAFANAPKAPA